MVTVSFHVGFDAGFGKRVLKDCEHEHARAMSLRVWERAVMHFVNLTR